MRMQYRILLLLSICLSSSISFSQQYKLKQAASGLKYHIVKPGTGILPMRGDMVNIYYTSRLVNDSIINKYDSTTGPMSFILGEGEILTGINEAVSLLKPGGKIYLEIPPPLAYGSRKIGKVPANSTIKASVELASFVPAFFHPLNKDTILVVPGLKKLAVKETKGNFPKISNNVTLNFTGYYFNSNGERKIFDKSSPEQKLTFQLGGAEMIRGLDLGLRTMREGEKATFIISPDLAYKKEKRGELPPNTTIYLDVELVFFTDPFFQLPDHNDTISTTSGLRYLIAKKGTGNKPGRNDIVSVRFLGYIIDSTGNKIIFDKIQDNKSWSYRIGSKNILPGLNEGISEMNIGAQYRLIIPPDLAFSQRQIGIIKPNSTVYYDIELENMAPMTFLSKGDQDTIKLKSGVKILLINKETTDAKLPDSNATIVGKFTGYFIDSLGIPSIFENTQEEGKPYEFHLNHNDLIRGMKEALRYLPEGQVAKLFIPAHLAYGSRGVQGLIPPNKDLVFDIQILKILEQAE